MFKNSKKLRRLTKGREFALKQVKFLAERLKEPRKVFSFITPGASELFTESDASLRRMDIISMKNWGQISVDYKKAIEELKSQPWPQI